MSEEMKELQTNEVTETMADYEDHFDDANPWNRVQDYMDKKTVLPVKIEGVVNGGVIVMVEGLRGFVPRQHDIKNNTIVGSHIDIIHRFQTIPTGIYTVMFLDKPFFDNVS